MNKEELTRIKQAYNSGLKVQIWFDGCWENFDARDYSMYLDPFSENRQYRIVGSAYADIAEKRIAELEKENAELKNKLGKVAQEILDNWCKGNPPCPHLKKRDEQLTKAKELFEDLIRFQPYIDKEMIFHSIGNEWKTAIYKAKQFLDSEVEHD